MAKQRPGFMQFTDRELEEVVDRFCDQTNRDRAHTLRVIVRLFFAEGPELAELRLTQDLWGAGPEAVRVFEDALRAAARPQGQGHKKRRGAER